MLHILKIPKDSLQNREEKVICSQQRKDRVLEAENIRDLVLGEARVVRHEQHDLRCLVREKFQEFPAR